MDNASVILMLDSDESSAVNGQNYPPPLSFDSFLQNLQELKKSEENEGSRKYRGLYICLTSYLLNGTMQHSYSISKTDGFISFVAGVLSEFTNYKRCLYVDPDGECRAECSKENDIEPKVTMWFRKFCPCTYPERIAKCPEDSVAVRMAKGIASNRQSELALYNCSSSIGTDFLEILEFPPMFV